MFFLNKKKLNSAPKDGIHYLETLENLDSILKQSKNKKIVVFKHSTICPVSTMAREQWMQFIQKKSLTPYCILVREHRPISNEMEKRTGIHHQSPQIFFLENEIVYWHTSHGEIQIKNLEDKF